MLYFFWRIAVETKNATVNTSGEILVTEDNLAYSDKGISVDENKEINSSENDKLKKEGNIFIIETFTDLEKIGIEGYPLDAHYRLDGDIDASPTYSNSYNNARGWKPIGEVYDLDNKNWKGFSGILDGQGHKIENLYINNYKDMLIGLFKVIDKGTIKNLELVNVDIKAGEKIGSLAGYNNGIIKNVKVSGDVTGQITVGGLVAYNSEEASISKALSDVEVEGIAYTGGIVGKNHGIVDKASFIGEVDGKMKEEVKDLGLDLDFQNTVGVGLCGGIVGFNYGTVSNSYTEGDVSGERDVGGLVGTNYSGIIKDSYASGNIEGNDYTGGLVGVNDKKILSSYAVGRVRGTIGVGGLVGMNTDESIINSYALGDVIGEKEVGGLVGINGGSLESCYAGGSVRGDKISGGLVGFNIDNIVDCYAQGNVLGDYQIGGFVGKNHGNIKYSYALGDISGNGSIGGFVGNVMDGTIENSYYGKNNVSENTDNNGTAKSRDELKRQATYVGWDFNNTWAIEDDKVFPYLRWQGLPEDYLKLIIVQDGKEVEIKNDEVTLKKKPFKIRVYFKDEIEAYVCSSFKTDVYNKFKEKPSYDSISKSAGKSFAIAENNKNLYVVNNTKCIENLDLPAYLYLNYYDQYCRFNKVIKKDNYMVAENTFENILIADRDRLIPIEDLNRNVLYTTILFEEQKEYINLKIKFIPSSETADISNLNSSNLNTGSSDLINNSSRENSSNKNLEKWETYDGSYYEFKYPKNWSIEKDLFEQGNNITISPTGAKDDKILVMVFDITNSLPRDFSRDNFYEFMMEKYNIKENNYKFNMIKINGSPAVEIDCITPFREDKYKGKIIDIYVNSTLLEVMILAKEDKQDLIDEIYNNFVKSIKLK